MSWLSRLFASSSPPASYPPLEEIPIFVVNLLRARRRRLAMCLRLLREGLYAQATFVPAVDAREEKALVSQRRGAHSFPRHPVSDGEVACFMSHLRALRMFLATGRPYGLILEDDSKLCLDFAEHYQRSLPSVPGLNLLMLTHYLASKEAWAEDGRDRRWLRITGQTYNAGAYLIKREYAQECVQRYDRPWDQIDHPQQRFTSEHITIYSGGLCLKQPLVVAEAEDSFLRGSGELEWHKKYFHDVVSSSELLYK